MFQGGDQATRRRGRSSKAYIYKVSCQNIKRSRAFRQYNQAIKANLCESKILIPVAKGSTGLMKATTTRKGCLLIKLARPLQINVQTDYGGTYICLYIIINKSDRKCFLMYNDAYKSYIEEGLTCDTGRSVNTRIAKDDYQFHYQRFFYFGQQLHPSPAYQNFAWENIKTM